MEINIFNIIIICGIVQGLIFSAIVLTKKRYQKNSYKYLALLVLTISLSNLYYWFKDTGISNNYYYYRLTYLPYDLLILPFFYLFVCSYLNLKKKYAYYLLLPFALRTVIQLFTILYQLWLTNFFSISDTFISVVKQIDEYGTIAFMIFNIVVLFKVIYSYQKEDKKEITWIKQLLYFGLSLAAILLLTELFRDFIPDVIDHKKIYYLIWIGLSVIIYWLGYSGIYHLGLFTKNNQTKRVAKKIIPEEENQNRRNRFVEIDETIREQKMYQDPNLSLQVLSDVFELSEGYLSQLINQNNEMNFAGYINGLRIEEAKKMLLDDRYSNYTIVAIGLEAGFNSKSAFYSAFRKYTGFSPSEFQKMNLS